METLNLRDVGPFTPKEAAKRVQLASMQLKWFTLCQPHWSSAHFSFEWSAAYPLPRLPVPKGVRITCVKDVSGKFTVSRSCEEIGTAMASAAKQLDGIAHVFFLFFGPGRWNKPGLWSLSFKLKKGGDWQVDATVFHEGAPGREAHVRSAVETGLLKGVGDWRLVKSRETDGGRIVESELSCVVAYAETNGWSTRLGAILSSQAKPIKTGKWSVVFSYDYQRSEDDQHCGRCWLVWKPKDPSRTGLSGEPEELFKLVNSANLPGTKAEVEINCTLDRVEDFLALFEFASKCEPAIQGPIGIFETDKGKQGFMLFDSNAKGIRLWVAYGRNGWEEVHEELRRTGGKLAWATKR